MWDEITYPFANFNGWEWISNFIPHFSKPLRLVGENRRYLTFMLHFNIYLYLESNHITYQNTAILIHRICSRIVWRPVLPVVHVILRVASREVVVFRQGTSQFIGGATVLNLTWNSQTSKKKSLKYRCTYFFYHTNSDMNITILKP